MKPTTTKRIIILSNIPFYGEDDIKYAFGELLQLDYEVCLADISKIVYPKIFCDKEENPFSSDQIDSIIIEQEEKLISFVKNNSNSFFLPLFFDYYDVRIVYSLFDKYRIRYGYINSLMVYPTISSNARRRLDFSLESIRRRLYNRVLKRLVRKQYAEFIAFGGEDGTESLWKAAATHSKYTQKAYLWSFNYELFKEARALVIDYKYAVFVDEFLPFHKDLLIDDSYRIDAVNYYRELNELFDVIEKKMSLRIIVAAHPKAYYADKPYCFPGREVYYGQIAGLVKNAECILGHHSTALNYAVMARKPMLILCPPSCRPIGDCCMEMAVYYCAGIVSKPDEVGEFLYMNGERYDELWHRVVSCFDEPKGLLWQKIVSLIG